MYGKKKKGGSTKGMGHSSVKPVTTNSADYAWSHPDKGSESMTSFEGNTHKTRNESHPAPTPSAGSMKGMEGNYDGNTHKSRAKSY